MLAINMKNKIGPGYGPCGTPMMHTLVHIETFVSVEVSLNVGVRTTTKYPHSFAIESSKLTVPKAVEESKCITVKHESINLI